MLPKAVVLMGAGASVEFGMPSTQNVYKYIIDKFKQDERSQENFALEILNAIECELFCFYKNKEKINFESIFHALTILSGHMLPIDDRTSDDFRYLDKVVTKIRKCFRKYSYENFYFIEQKYIEFLNTLFIEKSKEFEKHENYCFLKKYFSLLMSKYQAKVFSLNYDDLPLQCDSNLYTGMTEKGEFDKQIFENSREKNTFFQLHGSIRYDSNWRNKFTKKQDGAHIFEHNIVTGYDKSDRLQKQPFRTFANMFELELSSCEIVFIIGYSFSDLHINAVLKDYTKDKKVFFIDYNKFLLLNMTVHEFPLSSLNFFSGEKLGRDISLMNYFDFQKIVYTTSHEHLIELDRQKYLWFNGFKSFIEKFEKIIA